MVRTLLACIVALGAAACSVPSNPDVVQEPAWDSPQTRALAVKAGCFDCHSNETVWPWYTRVPIANSAIVDHVEEGRHELNFSRMDRRQKHAHEAAEEVEEGHMPPDYYSLLHPSAKLSDVERAQLIAGLDATFGGDGRGHDEEEEDDDD